MNLKWCAFTGAIMLGFVALTFLHKGATQDPKGVTTRWWDGTVEKVETYYENGKVASVTVFGDDGKTVLLNRTFTYSGVLESEKVRRKDGKVETRVFEEDGKTVSHFELLVGDESYFLERRDFRGGKLLAEVIMTEDGTIARIRRQFDFQGQLLEEYQILENASQQTDRYQNGKLVHRDTFYGNGDAVNESFHANGKLNVRSTRVKLTEETKAQKYSADGKLEMDCTISKDGVAVVTEYDGDKVKAKFTHRYYQLELIEEFSVETGLLKRSIKPDLDQNPYGAFHERTPNVVNIYRKDGTLESVKYMKGGSVVRQLNYDDKGETVKEEKAEADAAAETVEEMLFFNRLNILMNTEGGTL